MGDIQKVSVALTSGQLAALKAVVDAGEYATTSEIVRKALRDWQHKRDLRQEEINRLPPAMGRRQSKRRRGPG
jgi:antitoxin ParD1/3/4